MTKTISADDRLRAFALFTMAAEHTRKAREFEDAMKRLLGTDDASFISDALWGYDKTSAQDFDDALAKEGIEVEA